MYSAPHAAMIVSGNDHLIELNDISRVCRETRDTGSIYMGRDWTQRGHTIRWNYIHHVTGVVELPPAPLRVVRESGSDPAAADSPHAATPQDQFDYDYLHSLATRNPS